ncbi:MAG: metallophosphoesterase [Acidobacteriia bacterium]|nr:metallophosphoesterase [Terriglobia bacterium]
MLASIAACANWRLGTWLKLPKPFWMAGIAVSAAGILMGVRPIMRRLPQNDLFDWLRAIGSTWAMISTLTCFSYFFLRWLGSRAAHDPARRRLLQLATAPALAAPAVILGYGILGRNRFSLKTIDITIPHLPPGLVGLRLVQLTDIHMSPFFTATELEYAVGMANETNSHIALVTGDLITMRRDPLDRCLRILSRLRASDGVYGCLGNHEIFASCEDYATLEAARYGIKFLRSQSAQLRIGGAGLNLAGVDYQRMGGPYLQGVKSLLQPGSTNILLSHNPDVFPVAARMGYDLTVAGHTHGGQITVEILNQYANVARFFTPYVSGLYRQDHSSIYVSRGLGTVGVPARLGAPPELTLLRLCAG